MSTAAAPTGLPLAVVEWRDSCSIDRWTPLSEADFAPIICRTFGAVVGETEEYIAIAGSVANGVEGGQACQVMCIPKSAIISRSEVS